MKRIKIRFVLWFLIALFVLGASMNIFLLGSTFFYSADNQTFSIVTTSDSAPEEDNTPSLSANNRKILDIKKCFQVGKNNLKNLIAISSLVILLKGICVNVFFVVISIIFYHNLFKSKPDDWNLINQKVRLDN